MSRVRNVRRTASECDGSPRRTTADFAWLAQVRIAGAMLVGRVTMLAPHVLYRSPALIAVDKPPGLAVHRGDAQDDCFALTLVRDAVRAYLYPVHRLDRGTSGVLIFALSKEAAREIAKAFELGAVEKYYWALVRGVPPEQAVVDHALSREDGKASQAAVTEIRTLGRYGRYALVEAKPRTGRLHQIRRHLKHLSCPLIGDVRYGKGEHNRWFRAELGLSRLALHARKLRLVDPSSGEHVVIEAPMPADFAGALTKLEEAVKSGVLLGPPLRG